MNLKQNDLEMLRDMMQKGLLTAAQANVEQVKIKRVWLVSKLPAQVRQAFNAAVKTGELGHMRKDGHKPEVYFHPTFAYLAIEERRKHEASVVRSLCSVLSYAELQA